MAAMTKFAATKLGIKTKAVRCNVKFLGLNTKLRNNRMNELR